MPHLIRDEIILSKTLSTSLSQLLKSNENQKSFNVSIRKTSNKFADKKFESSNDSYCNPNLIQLILPSFPLEQISTLENVLNNSIFIEHKIK
jgi:hypothetical protein